MNATPPIGPKKGDERIEILRVVYLDVFVENAFCLHSRTGAFFLRCRESVHDYLYRKAVSSGMLRTESRVVMKVPSAMTTSPRLYLMQKRVP